MELTELLWHCFRHFYGLDISNAAMHTADVRYSPITFRLAEELKGRIPGGVGLTNDEYDVLAVLADLGAYPEDPGR